VATTSTGLPPEATTTGVDGETDDGTSTGPPPVKACVMAPEPADGACAEDCTSCDDGWCEMGCQGAGACSDETITCEPGRPCHVTCQSSGTCQNATIECPAEHECVVECSAAGACVGARIVCGDGPCSLSCQANDACTDLLFECGPADGTVTCDDPRPIDVVPAAESSCACVADGCR
jgi:hypothetical protein